MKNAAAISAQLVDIRNVGVHKSLKLTIHVPEEQALKAIEVFGWPTGASPVPVALARLVNPAEEIAHKPPPAQNPEVKAGAARKPVAPEKKLAQRIGILCSETVFQKFLCWEFDHTSCDEAKAAETVRNFCHVGSRANITPGTFAAQKWDVLYSRYIGWRDEPDLAEAAE